MSTAAQGHRRCLAFTAGGSQLHLCHATCTLLQHCPCKAHKLPRPFAGDPAGGAPSEQLEEEEAAAKAGKSWDSLRSIGWDEVRAAVCHRRMVH